MSNLSSILHSLNNNHLKRKTTFINFIFNSVTKLSIGSISLISRLVRGVQRNLSRRGGGAQPPLGPEKWYPPWHSKFCIAPPLCTPHAPCSKVCCLTEMVYLFQNNSPIFENMKHYKPIFYPHIWVWVLWYLCQNNHNGFTWKLAAWVENISVSFRSLWIFTSFKHTIFIFLFKINFIEHIQQIGR